MASRGADEARRGPPSLGHSTCPDGQRCKNREIAQQPDVRLFFKGSVHAGFLALTGNKHGSLVAGAKMLVGAAIGKTLDDSIEGRVTPDPRSAGRLRAKARS